MNEQDRRQYLFGTYVLDLAKASLFRGGEVVFLGRRSFETLRYFVLNPSRVITKEDLLKNVWSGAHVVENNVDRQISNLRKVLGTTTDSREYIETIRGDGFRFTVDVQVRESPKPEPLANNQLNDARLSRFTYVAIGALLLIACLSYLYFRGVTEGRMHHVQARRSYLLGLQRLESGDMLKAEATLETVVTLDPPFAPAHAALSLALLSAGYETRARDEARKAMELSNGLTREEALFVKAQFYVSNFDWQQAKQTFETLHSLAPDRAEWNIQYALALSKVGKHENASEQIAKMKGFAQAPALLGIDLAEIAVTESASEYADERRMAERLEKGAKAANLLYQAGHAELSEAWSLDNLSQLTDAESKAADAKDLLSKIGDIGGVGQAWKLLGDVYADQSRLVLAASAYQQAMSSFQKIGWLTGLAVALNNYGYVLRDLGDLQGARNSFDQSISISRSIGNLSREALALNGAAIVLKRMGNLTGAEQVYQAAIEIAKRLANDGSLATHLNNLAIVLQDEGKLDEARVKFEQAMQLFRKLGRRVDVAMVFGNLGDLEVRAGELQTAERNYKSEVDLGISIPTPNNLGYAFLGLGEIWLLRGDLRQARLFFGKSYSVRKHLNEAGTLAETSLALAEVDLEERDFKSAGARAQKSASQFAHERQDDQEAVARAVLAESLVGQRKLTEALAAADLSKKLLAVSEDKDSQMSARLHLWRVFEAAGSRDEALATLMSVRTDAEKSNYLPNLLAAQLYLAQIDLRSEAPGARHEFTRIRRDAAAKHFLLIEQKASAFERFSAPANPH